MQARDQFCDEGGVMGAVLYSSDNAEDEIMCAVERSNALV